jgi:hypothetical protein
LAKKEVVMVKRLFAFTSIALGIVSIPLSIYAGWMRTCGGSLDDMGNRVFQTSDGGYVIAGTTKSFGAGESDIWLLKTDSLGDTLWTRTYGGSDDEGIVCLNQTFDGGYILAAQTYTFNPYGKSDIWLLKTDSLGDTLWTLVYGTDNRDFPGYVGERLEGGYVVIGGAMDGGFNYKILFISVDAQGELEYVKDHPGFCTCANKFSDSLYLVVSTNDVLQFSSQGDYLTEREHPSAWIIYWIDKYDNWWKENSYILTGTQYPSELEVPDLWVGLGDLRDGETGSVLFGEPYTLEQGFCARNTSDSGFIVVGEKENEGSGYDLWLIKEGSTSWQREFGGSNDDAGFCVDTTSDGGYIITGITRSYGAGGKDLWLIKTDSLGYVDVEEESPIQVDGNWAVETSIGPQIVLCYADRPDGFHASIFDASGRKVDKLQATGESGMITWGEGYGSGVYFIRVIEGLKGNNTSRVVIIH